MPRNVRNFWIELHVDGKAVPVACGPARADGGFNLKIFQRSAGSVTEALRVSGHSVRHDDVQALTLYVEPQVPSDGPRANALANALQSILAQCHCEERSCATCKIADKAVRTHWNTNVFKIGTVR